MNKIKICLLIFVCLLCMMISGCKKDKGNNNENNNQQQHVHNYIDGVCSCGDKLEIKYHVSFTVSDEVVFSIDVLKDSKVSKIADPYIEGYLFLGWYLNDTLYDFNLAVTEDLNLTAKFEKVLKQYCVTINPDIDEESVTKEYVIEGNKLNIPTEPVKEGYKFLGWYVGDNLYDFDSIVEGDFTIVGKWESLGKIITITVDNSLDTPSTYVVEVIEGFKLNSLSTPVREGYNFLGWYVNDELYDFESVVTSEFTIYAKWEEIIIEYTITFRANGGDIENNTKKIVFTNYEDVVLPIVTRTNYEFIGWHENNVLVEKISENRNYTLTAKWVGATFNITYELNGGNFTVEHSDTYQYGQPYVLVNPERETYTFAGWYLNSDFSGTPIEKFGTSQKGDITLYAKWERFVTYELNGGNWSYKTRDDMVQDFLTDALKWAGKTNRPDGMVQGESDTRVGFANVFTAIYGIFSDSTYGAKWSWLKNYIIDVTENASTKSSLQSGTEAFWRYSLGAFLFEEYRTAWPISQDFTKDAAANSFWNYLSKGSEKVFILPEDGSLKTPVRIYYVFEGWYENVDLSGDPITTANKECTLYAKWTEEVSVESISITNKVTDLDKFESYQLTWQINPTNAAIKSVEFSSSNNNIALVSETGLITPLANGTVTITIKSLSPSGATDSFTINVSTPDHFSIGYVTQSYVLIGSDIQLSCNYILRSGLVEDVVWSSLNEDIATVVDGVVCGLKKGVATIRATASNKEYVDFVVTVLNESDYEELVFVLENHNSNVFTRYNLGIGAGVPVYYDDIIGGVSKFLFEDYVVHMDHYIEDPYCKTAFTSGVEFITVHYAADMTGSATSGGENLATFNKSKNEVARDASWHYGVGNDGIWACQNENAGAWHAGSSKKMTWTKTPIKYSESDPKYAKVTLESDGYFYLNGQNTNIKNTTSSNKLNKMGLAYRVVDGYYELGGHYYNSTYQFISSTGGNNNSIGMETSCAQGSDQWLTWQYTAQLVAHLLVKYNLDLTRVVGHHFFSGKDCPQQLLENDLEIWWEFMDMVEAEYNYLTKYKGLSLSFNVISGADILSDNGRIINQPTYDTVVSYEVTLSSGSSVILGSAVPGIYDK